ncbi:MAG: hypothetical protein KJO21_04100 [Verrucomicrobiae bacterium]|nr:hypothetical protein [Verrucomicrobiae bacterium]NNJ42681.1 hypothetical protein [Akkermansiaceae bacterium]
MKLKKLNTIIPVISLAALLVSCDKKQPVTTADNKPDTKQTPAAGHDEDDHTHDEVELGKFDIGGNMVEAAQGHGNVEAGKEGHLVIKLPYKDDGQTVTRAWIGTEDRTMSAVGKGEYAPSHDDYDIHAIAPKPLPAGAKWWLEIVKPDGTKAVGSMPLLKDIKSN